MKTRSINEISYDFSSNLSDARKEEILILDDGEPVGILIGFSSKEDYEDYRLENDPRFLNRIAESRNSIRKGRGIKLEEIDWDSEDLSKSK